MQFGVFVKDKADGTPYMGIMVHDGDVTLEVALANADNVDKVVEHLTGGFTEAKTDLKRRASGLVVANGLEVPDGFRRQKGRS